MQHILQTYTEAKFKYSGIPYIKNYISKVAGNTITIYNCYDNKDVLVEPSHFSLFEINGATFGSAIDVQEALTNLTYERNGLGGSIGSQNLNSVLGYGSTGSSVVDIILNRLNGIITAASLVLSNGIAYLSGGSGLFQISSANGAINVPLQGPAAAADNQYVPLSQVKSLLTGHSKVLLNDKTNSDTLGDTVVKTILRSYYIPPNIFADGDMGELSLLFEKPVATGNINYSIELNTANSLTGSVTIGFAQSSSVNKVVEISRYLFFESGTLKSTSFSGTIFNALYSSNSQSLLQSTPYVVSQGYYIMICAQLVTSSDRTYLDRVWLKRTKSKTSITNADV